jgi:hypothetical protein
MSRGLALGLVAWLAVVAVGSTMVWAVISRAGDDLVSSSETATDGPPEAVSSQPSPDDAAGGRSRSPSDGGPAPVRRTWQGQGGQVVAECDGSVVRLVSAEPDAGYAVDVGERGPARLEVEFEGREEEDGRETKLDVACVDGVPRFVPEVDAD